MEFDADRGGGRFGAVVNLLGYAKLIRGAANRQMSAFAPKVDAMIRRAIAFLDTCLARSNWRVRPGRGLGGSAAHEQRMTAPWSTNTWNGTAS
jgi:hypothetical protein